MHTVIIHLICGTIASISFFVMLATGFDFLADGITLFSNAGKLFGISFVIWIVSMIAVGINLYMFEG